MVKYTTSKGIIPETQHGFTRGRSTVTAIGAADYDWRSSKRKGQHTGALCFDLSSAFDLVSEDILVNKMAIYGMGETAIKWVCSYLSQRM